MAKDESHRLKPAQLVANNEAYDALGNIKNYSPANANYAINVVVAAHDDMVARQAAETQAFAAYQAARDDANKAEWAFHNIMLGLC